MNCYRMLELSALNGPQKKAVTYGEGPLLVLAGPGSGKTFTIVQRIFYLLQVKNVLPEQILVVTFTKDAALSMQRRFQCQSDRSYPVNFGTFHSVFYHILRETHSLSSQKIATEAQKKDMMKSALRGILPEDADAGLFLAAVSFYKNTEDRSGAEKKLPVEYREHFGEIIQRYEQRQTERGLFDFDDMVWKCRELLRKDVDLCRAWQRRFSYILLDEFQDINPIQYETIRLLAQERCQLFAVGDDDQSIYGFRGSNPACLKRFLTECRAEMLCLNINYRSCPKIVDASLQVISENEDRFAKKLSAAGQDGDRREQKSGRQPVELRDFEDRESQYEYLAGELAKLSREDASGETCAVLFRTNSYLQGFAAILSRLGVPYRMKEQGMGIYDHFIVQDIMAYLKLAGGQQDREALLRILNKPDRKLDRESLGWEERILIEQSGEAEALRKFKRDLRSMGKYPLYLQVQYIRKAAGYEKYLMELSMGVDEKRQEWQEILEWLTGEAKHYDTIAEWHTAMEDYRKARTGPEKQSRIWLMTVHGAKGLEFDRVWIPDCNEGVFPYGKMPDEETCKEERRIFYVAMTRAKKSLGLFYLTGTKERPRLPSRFLNPLRFPNPHQ